MLDVDNPNLTIEGNYSISAKRVSSVHFVNIEVYFW